jgi:CubicO group peptidase (beta-lactamase class C family)
VFAQARQIITDEVIGGRASPAAVVEVGSRAGVHWQEAFGRLTYADDAPACTTGTIFDLASLTKVICTTSLAMRLVGRRQLTLETPVAGVLDAWRGAEREPIMIRHLLDHSSGLPGIVRFWEHHAGRDAFRRALVELPLESPPGAQAVYSDAGFLLLGFVLEHIAEARLDQQFAPIEAALGEIGFLPAPHLRARIAPTEHDPWRGRLLVGDVHDENAAALGGVAPQAGLFGTIDAAGAFARLVLTTFRDETLLGAPDLMRTFARQSAVPGSSRALGWDTMRPTSSCGTRMSPTAIGHTGFTGTSLWIDWERDRYVVLITNRVHPTRANERLAALRPLIHDAILAET